MEDAEQEAAETREERRAALRKAIQAKRNGRTGRHVMAAREESGAAAGDDSGDGVQGINNLSAEEFAAIRNMAVRAGLVSAANAPSARKLKRMMANLPAGALPKLPAAALANLSSGAIPT